MRVLVLWADDRSTNLGVRVLGIGTSALIEQAFPGAEVTSVNFGLDTAPMRVGDWRALLKERVTGRRGLLAWLRTFDLAVDTRAGDSFADLYGLHRLATMSVLAELVRQAGVPVVMGPQTIGPFTTRRGTLMARASLRRAAAVMTRDAVSADAARRLGVEPLETTDVVFALPVPAVPRTRDVVLNVSGLLWRENRYVDASAYRATVASIVRGLQARGREVALLAHVLESDVPDNDVPAVKALAEELGHEVEAIVPGGLDEVRAVVASATIVLGSRMHACLNALSCGTPAIPLAYSRKFAPLLEGLGWEHTVDLRSDPDPVTRALALAEDPSVADHVTTVRQRADSELAGAITGLRDAANRRRSPRP